MILPSLRRPFHRLGLYPLPLAWEIHQTLVKAFTMETQGHRKAITKTFNLSLSIYFCISAPLWALLFCFMLGLND